MISKEADQKLQVKIDCHPKPYKLSWLKKGNKVTIDWQCLVSFSIVWKYLDNAWCNVLSMDDCHLLLDMSYQYNQSVVHNEAFIP